MRLLKLGLAFLPLLLVAASAPADETGRVILDQFGCWRMFHVLKSPEIGFDEEAKPIVYKSDHYWLNGESLSPPADWIQPAFDDGEWLCGPVGMGCRAPFVARACLRGKFKVTDPAEVKSIKLTLSYQGGVVVYLNGNEVGRKHLAAGAGLADAYPVEAFLASNGALLVPEGRMVIVSGKEAKGVKLDEEALRRVSAPHAARWRSSFLRGSCAAA